MALFDFHRPDLEETAAIHFEDESGAYSLGDLLNALWLRVASVHPDPNWLQWYRLLSRVCGYARVDACRDSGAVVAGWVSCPDVTSAAGHVFRDETGEVSLTALLQTIGTLAASRPTLAKRLARTIIHIAEVDQHRDRLARALLEPTGLLALDA